MISPRALCMKELMGTTMQASAIRFNAPSIEARQPKNLPAVILNKLRNLEEVLGP